MTQVMDPDSTCDSDSKKRVRTQNDLSPDSCECVCVFSCLLFLPLPLCAKDFAFPLNRKGAVVLQLVGCDPPVCEPLVYVFVLSNNYLNMYSYARILQMSKKTSFIHKILTPSFLCWSRCPRQLTIPVKLEIKSNQTGIPNH